MSKTLLVNSGALGYMEGMARTATASDFPTTRIPAFEAEGNLLALLPKSALGKERHVDIVVVGVRPGSSALIAELKTHTQGSMASAQHLRNRDSYDVDISFTHSDPDHIAALGSLISRLHRALHRAAGVASEDLVHRALERSSDMGAMIDLLRSTLPLLSAEQELDPDIGGQVSALSLEEELIQRAGGLKDTKWVADYLAISPKSVAAKARRNELLALTRGDRNLYPAFQFQDGQVIPGLRDLLQALPLTNGWSRLSFLLTPAPALDARHPLEAFASDLETVLALASGVDSQGAA